jgi:hypothetical protein
VRCGDTRQHPSSIESRRTICCEHSSCRALQQLCEEDQPSQQPNALTTRLPSSRNRPKKYQETSGSRSPKIVVGAPAACGRLRPGPNPVIDVLRSSIAKEQVDRCGASMDACIGKLLECWLDNLGDDEFESLGASATLYTSDAFERFGFAEIEFPDLTALGRGEPIVTHRARLSAAILACDARGNTALAEELRRQPPPSGKEEAAAPKKDPWAGAFKL